MTVGEFFAQAHICPVCHDDHGGPDCTPRRAALCWYADCDAELAWIDHQWECPEGHTLRQYQDLNPWLQDHITAIQGDPTLLRRYFGDPHDPPPSRPTALPRPRHRPLPKLRRMALATPLRTLQQPGGNQWACRGYGLMSASHPTQNYSP